MNRLTAWSTQHKALSEPLRIRLLSLVAAAGEMCVCDLITITGVSQSMVSRHLAYLRNSGWLVARRDKLWMHYRLADPEDQMAKAILEAIRQHGPQSQQIQNDLSALAQLTEPGSSC
ncbi:MAG: metalloregulator ArsR/SmtB family transcription factor [Magnetococcales bacterium]|nr:metalloregulator ArsR/SmtB family transcription factor [Magnetococcales bacterium]